MKFHDLKRKTSRVIAPIERSETWRASVRFSDIKGVSKYSKRFIVDPSDPSSGPVRPDVMHEVGSEKKRSEEAHKDQPFVSMNGLEGSWIPYGGQLSWSPFLLG